jgi:hypothetical protein
MVVAAWQCGAVGLVFGLLSLASIPLRLAVVFVPLFVVAFVLIVCAVVLNGIGMKRLYGQGLMPRASTNRHRAMMKAFWRDVTSPVRRGP